MEDEEECKNEQKATDDGRWQKCLLAFISQAQAYNLSRRLLKVSLHGGGRSRGRLLKMKRH